MQYHHQPPPQQYGHQPAVQAQGPPEAHAPPGYGMQAAQYSERPSLPGLAVTGDPSRRTAEPHTYAHTAGGSSATGGKVRLFSGYSEATSGGNSWIQTANGGSSGVSGTIVLSTGRSQGSGKTGDIMIGSGTATGGKGGDVIVTVGSGAANAGGDLFLSAGTTGGSAAVNNSSSS